ncbi:hypothetical protein POJ06DRAFT_247381 [Lipomyces tetrasporus]|uniref:Uncharacterized protein n=1 Tax=Lipomyces tetrasporus TaxID=54092 RepID=A0AAD7VVC1_9ASCO|nr:uncharacterized protein POJ06DRAFT_247381 [Lipomyces tetrasporus]KAJ8103358.1 hypothetical protein POJ06DRAFT_247381 [Lipomyces tetrasporus]
MSSTDSLSLSNKVAIITGSGKENGIGAAIALTLARSGARVTINYVSDSTALRAAKVLSTIESAVGKGRAIAVKADVSTAEGSKKIVEETLSGFGVDHINIIVNCASFVAYGTILDSKAEDIMKTFQVAVVGPVLLLQAAYPHIPRGGRIVNIGTVASKLGFVQMPIYAAAKAAMDQLTFTLAREIGRDGKNITVNTVAPGPVLTDSLPPVPEVEPVKDYLISLTRAEERVGTVEDIADAVLLLTSEKSRWITGQFISVSGGINGG